VITNNFNTNIHFLNSRDFGKRVLYTGDEVLYIIILFSSNTIKKYLRRRLLLSWWPKFTFFKTSYGSL